MLAVLLFAALAATAVAQERSYELEHLWTLPSLGDDYIIGAVQWALELPSGEILLLDRQTLEIHVVGPEGDYRRSIGREGGGPGEFRNPFGLARAADGRIIVNDGGRRDFPALWPDGTAAESWTLPEEYREGVWSSSGIMAYGDGFVMQLQGSSRDDNAMRTLLRVFAVDGSGKLLGEMGAGEMRIPHGRSPVRFSFEGQEVGPWSGHGGGWACYAPHRDRYFVEVYGESFRHIRDIERDQKPPRKPDDILDKERKDRAEFLRENPNGFLPELYETDPMIQGVRARAGGVVWVLPGGLYRRVRDEGLLGGYDIFDAEGQFVCTALFPGAQDPDDDLVQVTDRRLLLLRNGRDALRATRGGASSEEADEELDEALDLSIECYALPEELLALEGSGH